MSEETARILINPSRLICKGSSVFIAMNEHCFHVKTQSFNACKNQMRQVKLHILFFQRFIHATLNLDYICALGEKRVLVPASITIP
jgi:hypothetical protein